MGDMKSPFFGEPYRHGLPNNRRTIVTLFVRAIAQKGNKMNKPTTSDEMLKAVEADIVNSNCQIEDFEDLGTQRENCESYLRSLCEKAFKNGYELSKYESVSDTCDFFNVWGQATIERADFLRILRSYETDRTSAQDFPEVIEAIMEGIVSSFPYGELRLSEILGKIDEYEFLPSEVFAFITEDYFAEDEFDGWFDNDTKYEEVGEAISSRMHDILDWIAKYICLRMVA